MFKAAFGPDVQVDQQTITQAIAEYEKTLITPDSPFDEYLKGKEDAISRRPSVVTSGSRLLAVRVAIAVLTSVAVVTKSWGWSPITSRIAAAS
jgi:hypothetical protein